MVVCRAAGPVATPFTYFESSPTAGSGQSYSLPLAAQLGSSVIMSLTESDRLISKL